MSKGSKPRPAHLPTFRDNHDRIFGNAHRSDPIHAMTSGAYREHRSDCCGSPLLHEKVCQFCRKECVPVLTKID